MTFLPIVGRELRVAARRRATYWTRAAAALGAIAVGVFMQLTMRRQPAHEFGQGLFEVLSWISMFYCLFAGMFSTADCLSEEKREGTLGLLFLTDLKGYDVVFGKLFATSLGAFYGLLAIFPVMAVPLLLGGITNGEFWRMVLVLVNTFLFSLAMGMFVSSMSKSARKAMAATFSLVLFFIALLPVFLSWNRLWFWIRSRPLAEALWSFCPFTSFTTSFDQPYKAHMHGFWVSVCVIHALTWFCIVVASVVARRSWQDRPAGATLARWRQFWHRWSFGGTTERNAFRRRLLNVNAFYWLAGRARLKPAHVWVLYAVIAGLWSWGALENGKEWFNDVVYVMTAIALNSALKFWVASEAGRRLGEERKMGSLELLLSTPLGVRDILRGQLLALQRQFLAPILLAIIAEFIFMFASIKQDRSDDNSDLILFWVLYMIMLVADVIALSWTAMWVALTTKNPNRTTLLTLARVAVLPWIVLFVGMVLVGLMAAGGNGSAPIDSTKFFLSCWFGIGIVTDLFFGLSARSHLRNRFRFVAMHRFSTPPGRAGGWFRRGAAPVGAERSAAL